MLKILVIASTEHILKFKDQFSDSGFSLDYLIIEKQSSYDFGIFDQQHINIENEMAAIHKTNNEFQTLAQHDVLLKTQHQLRKLKYILYQSQKYKAQASVLKKIINQEASSDQVFSLDQSVDLILNSKSKKIHLEIKNSQVFEYDHIYIEDSHLTLKELSHHFPNQKLFTYNDLQVFQMVGLQFQTNTDIGEYSFWLMADMNYNSIYDNFHYLKSYQKMIDVWAWLPVQQVLNSANVIYLQERVRKKIEKKYDFWTLKAISKSFLMQPLNTQFEIINKYKSRISFIPHFHFYNRDEIEQSIVFINNQTIDKHRIKKEFFQNNQTESQL